MKLFEDYSFETEQELSFARQALIFVWELFKVIVISLAIIIPVRYFLIKPFYVEGASMEPNYYNHEYLIINEISYRFSDPRRGDVVVFKYPLDPSQYFIKRIIGLPGETLRIEDGMIYVYDASTPKGGYLVEDYLSPGMETMGGSEVHLAADEYYIMGDNRTASLDSRNFGPIKRQAIVGKTWVRGWPLSRFGLLGAEVDYSIEY